MNKKLHFIIPAIKGLQTIVIHDILWLESIGNNTSLIMRNADCHIYSKHLKIVLQMLECDFIHRIHKSHAINLYAVKSFDHEGIGGVVTLSSGKKITVSVRNKKLFLIRLGQL